MKKIYICFQENERGKRKKQTNKATNYENLFIWDYIFKYHHYVFLLCSTLLGFQLKMLLFTFVSGTPSLKADLCYKMLIEGLAWNRTGNLRAPEI